MKHSVIFRREGVYGAFPILNHLPDGRLTIGFSLSDFHDHYALGKWTVLVSEDEGDSWAETDDPSIPATWPASNPREQSDRFAGVMPDGSWVCAGVIGHEAWPASRSEEAEARGLDIRDHVGIGGGFVVNRPTVFVQRSTDSGQTWSRDEWDVPGFSGTGFSRPAVLADGTVLEPVYGRGADGTGMVFVWRGTDGGRTWRLHGIGRPGNEAAFVETEPGRVLCLARTEEKRVGWAPGAVLVRRRRSNLVPGAQHKRLDAGLPSEPGQAQGRANPAQPRVQARPDGNTRCAERGRWANVGRGQHGRAA